MHGIHRDYSQRFSSEIATPTRKLEILNLFDRRGISAKTTAQAISKLFLFEVESTK